jgi:type II secretory pathway pseudopilin PulG
MKKQTSQRGYILIGVLFVASLSVVVLGALVGWSVSSVKFARQVLVREQALQVAEAGIEYARWHLAHFQTDYTLGEETSGPHTYPFYDYGGNQIGSYTLTVTPPSLGSTIVTITSEGRIDTAVSASRTIEVRLAIPSLAKYAVVANDSMRFGAGTEIFGPLHSNGGIRFDGTAWNTVTSALAQYDDPDHSGANEFGVHTHRDINMSSTTDSFRALEAPPQEVPVRTDVFKAGREFPVPSVDFAGIISDLASIKSNAQTAGKYLAPSGAQGYQIVLKANDTYDVYQVQTVTPVPSGQCRNDLNETGWGTWSIQTKTFVGNYTLPENGLIFVEDTLWIEGVIDGARLTIAAARFPDTVSQRKNIIISNDITYTHKDGTDAIALIAQNNITIAMTADTSLDIDGALVAQNGRVGRYYYNASCGQYRTRTQITLFGMIATNKRYGFAFTDGSGYATRTIVYDTSLLYSPPPFFPLAAESYQIISWEERK